MICWNINWNYTAQDCAQSSEDFTFRKRMKVMWRNGQNIHHVVKKTKIKTLKGFTSLWPTAFTHLIILLSSRKEPRRRSRLNDSSTDEIALSNPLLKELHWNNWERGGQDERKIGALCIVEPSRGVFGLLCEVTLTALGIKEQSTVHGPNSRD